MGDTVSLCELDPTPVEKKIIEAEVKHRQRLTKPSLGGNQCISTGLNRWPDLLLHISRLADVGLKLVHNERMKTGERHGMRF